MTTPNLEFDGNITSFSFKKFPLEEKLFSVLLVYKSQSESLKTEVFQKSQSESLKTEVFQNLENYMKIIFPQKFELHSLTNKNWVNSVELFKSYLDPRKHILVIGNYESIPEVCFTNSKMIIFECNDDVNKYLLKNHKISLDNFNIKDNFILIDKSKIGHINIHGFPKNNLHRYNSNILHSI